MTWLQGTPHKPQQWLHSILGYNKCSKQGHACLALHSHPASGHLISIAPHSVGQLKRKPAGPGSLVNLLRGGDPRAALPKALSLSIHALCENANHGLLFGWRAAPETGAEMQYRWQREWQRRRIVSPGLETSKMRFTVLARPRSGGNTCSSSFGNGL